MDEEMMVEDLAEVEQVLPIGENEIAEAAGILMDYKGKKANLERRIVDDELWWELRHWDSMGQRDPNSRAADGGPRPTSAWLFNAILNKHADAMDNYPEPVVLPREKSDQESATTLSAVLPVVLEQNQYEQTYSDNWWEKLKHGTCAYGVFWNKRKENGLGDVDVKMLDLLKLFWEPGITDIQASRNLFILDMVDTDILEQRYPEFVGELGGGTIDIEKYVYDDTVDTSDKSVVVDWYYKRPKDGGGHVLHYCKFVGPCLLFASENLPEYQETGWYDHGQYPVVLDVMFPEKGTPTGFGYVAICKDPQMYIDKISANILESSLIATKKRYFVGHNTNVNVDEFLDTNQPIVTVEGSIDETNIKEIVPNPVYGVYIDIMNQKVEEMKDTVGNRDVNSGAGSGVTAASAIAALQEAGSKTSRDMIATAYRANVLVYTMALELMRQFYDETRSFRITGRAPGEAEFVEFSNQQIKNQPGGEGLFRRPVFDIKVSAQRKNPFSRAEQNERAKELYNMGFFNPERAQEAMGALEMMEFDGIDDVRGYVNQGQTMLSLVKEMSQRLAELTGQMAVMTGQGQQQGQPSGGVSPVARAQQPQTTSMQAQMGAKVGGGSL